MDQETIGSFINKVIDILQSNIYYKKNLIPWIKLIFEKHFSIILNLPTKTLDNFSVIRQLIINRTQYKEKLNYLGNKMNFIFDYYQKIKNNKNLGEENKKEYQPLLEYYESDDEDTIKKNKGKFIFIFLKIFKNLKIN